MYWCHNWVLGGTVCWPAAFWGPTPQGPRQCYNVKTQLCNPRFNIGLGLPSSYSSKVLLKNAQLSSSFACPWDLVCVIVLAGPIWGSPGGLFLSAPGRPQATPKAPPRKEVPKSPLNLLIFHPDSIRPILERKNAQLSSTFVSSWTWSGTSVGY